MPRDVASSLLLHSQVEADEFARAFHEDVAVGDGGVAARRAAHDLGASLDLEFAWTGFGELEFAGVGEDKEIAAGADDRAGAGLRLFPDDFAGGQFNAAKARTAALPGVAVKAVEVVFK